MISEENVFDDVNSFQNIPKYNEKSGCYSCESSVSYQIKLSSKIKSKRREEILFNIIYQFNESNRYITSVLEEESYMIYDTQTKNRVQISLEKNINSYMLYPFKNCHKKTMVDIFAVIKTHLDSDYNSIKPLKHRLN